MPHGPRVVLGDQQAPARPRPRPAPPACQKASARSREQRVHEARPTHRRRRSRAGRRRAHRSAHRRARQATAAVAVGGVLMASRRGPRTRSPRRSGRAARGVVEHRRAGPACMRQAIARLEPVPLVAERHVDRAFENPDLLMDDDVARRRSRRPRARRAGTRPRRSGSAGGTPGRRDVAADVARGRVPPLGCPRAGERAARAGRAGRRRRTARPASRPGPVASFSSTTAVGLLSPRSIERDHRATHAAHAPPGLRATDPGRPGARAPARRSANSRWRRFLPYWT